MIRLNHVSKIYGDGSKKAVDDLSWDIEDGKITGFIGPNGAGKTTTLKMITGILAPSEGTIEINGKDIQKDPLEAKRQFGFVPDDPDAFLRVRGIEYLNFMADIYGVGTEERQRFIEETAKRFEMEENLSSRIMSYSHGMRQKIMVMGALIHKPPVWILDEPLTGLDPRSAHELKQMMREHADAGNAVLFSTHVLEVAEKLCDRIAIIHHGRQVYLGTSLFHRKDADRCCHDRVILFFCMEGNILLKIIQNPFRLLHKATFCLLFKKSADHAPIRRQLLEENTRAKKILPENLLRQIPLLAVEMIL